jgi:hypothetical protein
MNDAEMKYQAERKEREILQLQKSNAVRHCRCKKNPRLTIFLSGQWRHY